MTRPDYIVLDGEHRPIPMSEMTLRDFFAAQALASFPTLEDGQEATNLAHYVYEVADAMLAERAK